MDGKKYKGVTQKGKFLLSCIPGFITNNHGNENQNQNKISPYTC